MPKYFKFAIDGYYLYFTSQCIVEAFHVHASDKKLTEQGSAKFFVNEDGSVKVMRKGRLSSKSIGRISEFITENYKEMYEMWIESGGIPEFYKK